VRIVAATNRKLIDEMKAGRFREDLYYRLNVISIDVPPLRERQEDIPALVEHFLKKHAAAAGRPVAQCANSALDLLKNHPWHGNVRELEHAIERAVVMASGPMITPADLPAALRCEGAVPSNHPPEPSDGLSLHAHERRLIARALKLANWNKYQAAKLLQITRTTLYSKIEKYGLTPDNANSVNEPVA
jgi:DNA-binding NtrC family response regulator